MTTTALSVINRAFSISGVVGKEFRQVTPVELKDGLQLLNDLLSEKTLNVSANSYYTEYDFEFVEGQESYEIDGLIYAETLTFNINSVRYSIRAVKRDFYHGTSRANGIDSLPAMWMQEPYNGGTKISVYFLPKDAYDAKIIGKFGYESVTTATNMETVYERYYIKYLTIELARAICIYWGYEILPALEMEYKRLTDMVTKRRASMDTTVKKLSTFSIKGGDLYSFANLYTGWLP